jgi:pyruvate/2-oxoglutarate dehydrogenase complex dihydrolipoamide acyltransferase (E2) component
LAHGINSRGQEQILFHDVDISLPLEKDVKGIRVPLPMLITAVNRKSVTQIKQEIQSAREQSVDGAEDYVLNGQQAKGSTAFFFKLPGLLRGLVWRYLLGNPFRRKKYMGTAIITNIGMSGGISAWIIPKSIHNLAFGMGTIVRKPGVVGNRIEIRDILHLTVQLDHDVIDGAPAARFTAGLVRNIESARFLDAMDPDS